jgi:hypothetical protein
MKDVASDAERSGLRHGSPMLSRALEIRHGTRRRGGPPRAIHALPSSRTQKGVDDQPSPSMTWRNKDGSNQSHPVLDTVAALIEGYA